MLFDASFWNVSFDTYAGGDNFAAGRAVAIKVQDAHRQMAEFSRQIHRDAVRARVQALGFTKGSTFIQDIATVRKNDADPAYNPNAGAAHPQVLFGKLTGEVAFYDATAKTWRDYDYSAGVSAASRRLSGAWVAAG